MSKQRINHSQSARHVIEKIGYENILCSKDTIWTWNNNGVWVMSEDRSIKQKIQRVLDGHDYRKSEIDSILDIIKTVVYKENHSFDFQKESINCQNGELIYINKNWVLSSHKRENYRTSQIPVHYDLNAKCPMFDKFLDEIFSNNHEKEKLIQLVYETIGYCLLSTSEYEKFFIFLGSGANGKSVLLRVITELLGQKNVAGVQPYKFENSFQLAHLFCKLANIITEIPKNHKLADGPLKAITSGELITAEYKHQKPFDFRPYCTLIFATNYMPHTSDFSNGLLRRIIIIPFNRVFQEKEQDRKLADKLILELPGIFNRALQALKMLFERGEFTKVDSCEEAKREWELQNNHLLQFIEDKCITDINSEEQSGKLFDEYTKWCSDNLVNHRLSRNNFTKEMQRKGFNKKRGAGGTRYIEGIKLKRDD